MQLVVYGFFMIHFNFILFFCCIFVLNQDQIMCIKYCIMKNSKVNSVAQFVALSMQNLLQKLSTAFNKT